MAGLGIAYAGIATGIARMHGWEISVGPQPGKRLVGSGQLGALSWLGWPGVVTASALSKVASLARLSTKSALFDLEVWQGLRPRPRPVALVNSGVFRCATIVGLPRMKLISVARASTLYQGAAPENRMLHGHPKGSTTGLQLCQISTVRRAPARGDHFLSPGDIISE